MPRLTSLAKLAQEALEDLKGVDIKVLDVQKLTSVTDFMLVCTGNSNRHVKSLADSVAQKAKENGVRPLGVEGEAQGEWVLVDLGSVVVHVMQAQTRAFYQLEKLWSVPDEPPPAASARPPRKAAAKKKAGARKAKAPRKTSSRAPFRGPNAKPKAKARPKPKKR